MVENPDIRLINCIIADDEPLARIGMKRLVEQVSYLNLVGIAKDVFEISGFLAIAKVDLLFLDIHMPKISGIEFLKTLQNPPKVIFTTAFAEYALKGYELDVLDYLLKPVTLDRFLKSAHKAKEYFESADLLHAKKGATEKTDFLFIKTSKKIEKVFFKEILFVKAMLNYVVLFTENRKLVTYTSIKKISDRLPTSLFLKIHKSYIVSVSHINSLERNHLKIQQHTLPVSRAHKAELIKMLGTRKP